MWCGLRSIHAQPAASANTLRVVVTSPDLASLAREVGGDCVRVSCLSQGQEDSHTIEVSPGFVRELNAADLFIQVGLGIESVMLGQMLVHRFDLPPGQLVVAVLGAALTAAWLFREIHQRMTA